MVARTLGENEGSYHILFSMSMYIVLPKYKPHVHGEVYSIQHYVMKYVSDMRHVGGFLLVLQFPPPIKLKYCWKWH